MLGDVANGFPPILGIFYAVFDHKQGSKVCCQVPDGLIIPTETPEIAEPLISFDLLKNYIIPKPALCNRLIGVRSGKCYVLGHPICISDEGYERNSFIFNLVLVFANDSNVASYVPVVKRTANMFKVLEEQSRYLSSNCNQANLDSIIEQMYQDLNSYSECQIPIDEANKVDIKLFPLYKAPPMVQSHEVPITTLQLENFVDETIDPTLERIMPYINGINSVRRIADLAEADYELTKQCIQHLLHYECVIIIGLFQFSNVYAPGQNLSAIGLDRRLYHELCAFVYFTDSSNNTKSQLTPLSLKSEFSASSGASNISGASTDNSATPASGFMSGGHGRHPRLTIAEVLKLYAAFQNGQSVYNWYKEHAQMLQDIDVRRFLIFGVIHRLIYRVHAWPISSTPKFYSGTIKVLSDKQVVRALANANFETSQSNVAIVKRCLSAPHSFDALCTELRASRANVCNLLGQLGDWVVIHR